MDTASLPFFLARGDSGNVNLKIQSRLVLVLKNDFGSMDQNQVKNKFTLELSNSRVSRNAMVYPRRPSL